jgi:mxaJ protein
MSPGVERLALALPLMAFAAIAAPRVRDSIRLSPVQAAEARTAAPTGPRDGRVLRVCADPNNLPFSNARGEGLENKLAELIAGELGAKVEYTWWAQRRGFTRNTLRAGLCDLIPGIPSSFELAMPTRPYYRSTYVFVQRRSARHVIRSFDDPALKTLRIGVQFIGDDGANTPPVHALSNRHIVGNIVGFSVYGDYRQPNPPARIIEAVARGDVDIAIVWGPLAGYFAPRQAVPLTMTPVSPQIDLPFLPFVFDIAMGVRRDAPGLKSEVEGVLERRRATVDSLVAAYGVPLWHKAPKRVTR